MSNKKDDEVVYRREIPPPHLRPQNPESYENRMARQAAKMPKRKNKDGSDYIETEDDRQRIEDWIGVTCIGIILYAGLYYIFLRTPAGMYQTTSMKDQHDMLTVFFMCTFWYPLAKLNTFFFLPFILCVLYPLYMLFHNVH